jgi:cobalamin biosynthesis Mg chelatase CobN
MRTRASLAAILAACLWAAAAHAGGPGDVYNDYAQDGRLSCNHSRADLVAVLRSGSLNQYGDPLTLARLKLAVRKQLAGGCRRGSASGQSGTSGTGAPNGGGTSSGQKPRSSKGSPARHPRGRKAAPPSQATSSREASTASDSASFLAGRGLIVGLLVAALAFGGWLTKHALAARD